MKDNGMRGTSYDQAGGSASGGIAAVVTGGKGGGLTQVIVILVLALSILGGLFLVGQAAYTEYLRFTGQLELRRAEAETERLRAEVDMENATAARMEAEGKKIEATGELALDIATGRAISAPAEAAARTVDRQSQVATFWGFITPGMFISLMLVSSCLGGVGGPLALLVLVTFGKRYLPEFLEAWQKAKADYDARRG